MMASKTTRPKTILEVLRAGEVFRAGNRPISSVLPGSQERPLLAMATDNGNRAGKAAVLNRQGRLAWGVCPNAYRSAKDIQIGRGITTFQVNKSDPFWCGEDALGREPESLHMGATPVRLRDARQVHLIVANLVNTLLQAGYKPGAYNIALGFAIPNDEIVMAPPTTEGGEESLGAKLETRKAIREHLRREFEVSRLDEDGTRTDWVLNIVKVLIQAQSIGTNLCSFTTPSGQDLSGDFGLLSVQITDIGGGDFQRTDIEFNPYRMSSERPGDGTVVLAQALARRLRSRGIKLNTFQAQEALVSREVRIPGRVVSIADDVEAVLATTGESLISLVQPTFVQGVHFPIISAGGAVLLSKRIQAAALAAGKVRDEDYFLIDGEEAVILNALGALFAVLFAAHAQQAQPAQ